MDANPSCSDAALLAGEPIAGTATGGMTQWLIIENCGPWPRKGLPESMRPDLRAAAEAAAAAVPGTRLLLARGERAPGPGGPRIWIVRSSPAVQAAQVVQLAPETPAATLDLEARLRGIRWDGAPVERLLLVCTHGQRDRCCARIGMPVYQALRRVAPGETLRASHLGGHRFAPTVLALPLGAHFGRVQPGDARPLVDAVRAGERGPARLYRGRSFLDAPAQAAACHLHDALDEPRLDALEVVGTVRTGADTAAVRIRHAGREHRVRLGLGPLPDPQPKSCGEAPVAIQRWRVLPS